MRDILSQHDVQQQHKQNITSLSSLLCEKTVNRKNTTSSLEKKIHQYFTQIYQSSFIFWTTEFLEFKQYLKISHNPDTIKLGCLLCIKCRQTSSRFAILKLQKRPHWNQRLQKVTNTSIVSGEKKPSSFVSKGRRNWDTSYFPLSCSHPAETAIVLGALERER